MERKRRDREKSVRAGNAGNDTKRRSLREQTRGVELDPKYSRLVAHLFSDESTSTMRKFCGWNEEFVKLGGAVVGMRAIIALLNAFLSCISEKPFKDSGTEMDQLVLLAEHIEQMLICSPEVFEEQNAQAEGNTFVMTYLSSAYAQILQRISFFILVAKEVFTIDDPRVVSRISQELHQLLDDPVRSASRVRRHYLGLIDDSCDITEFTEELKFCIAEELVPWIIGKDDVVRNRVVERQSGQTGDQVEEVLEP